MRDRRSPDFAFRSIRATRCLPMVALKTGEIDSFIARPDAKRPIALVFGPDAGLVRERVDALIKTAVDDPADPFALAPPRRRRARRRADAPRRGGAHDAAVRRAPRRVGQGRRRSFVEAVETLLAAPPAADCRVVIEAGDLRRNAPLRALCEKSPVAAAIVCYVDVDRELARLIDDEMRAAGLAITADARALLASLIGGDRRASRNEIRKLALYAHGKSSVDLDDVLAVGGRRLVARARRRGRRGLAGRAGEAETQFAKARAAGTYPGVIVGAALRQVAQLHRARLASKAARASTRRSEARCRGLHFRRKSLVEAALSGVDRGAAGEAHGAVRRGVARGKTPSGAGRGGRGACADGHPP